MRRVAFHIASKPDERGRRSFTVYRFDEGGIWRSGPSPAGALCTGYCRAQCFRTRVEPHVERSRAAGASVLVTEDEDEAIRFAWSCREE